MGPGITAELAVGALATTQSPANSEPSDGPAHQEENVSRKSPRKTPRVSYEESEDDEPEPARAKDFFTGDGRTPWDDWLITGQENSRGLMRLLLSRGYEEPWRVR